MSTDFTKLFLKNADPFTDLLGQDAAKFQLKSTLLAGRHVLIVGTPGIGKTTLAKNVAKLLPTKKRSPGTRSNDGEAGAPFVRVQGSPDLTVEDLLGDIDPIKALKFGPSSKEAFTPGKIFKADGGVLFFDEVNRCPEKIQNSLLQVLEEGFATIGSYTVKMPSHFVFLATMNPEEVAATEKLSDVFLDRLDLIAMTHPDSDEIETRIVLEKGRKQNVKFSKDLLHNMIVFVRDLRIHKDIHKKPSVRVSLGLYERAQANALLNKHKSVTLDDIESAIFSVLSHRIELKPSVKYLQSTKDFLAQELKKFKEKTALTGGGGL